MDNNSQLKLFNEDSLKPKLGEGFKRINQAISQGLIAPYTITIKGVPVWDPPIASESKCNDRNNFVSTYGRATKQIEVDGANLPDELKPLQEMGFTFLRNKDSNHPQAIFFRKNGQKIVGLDSNCDYAITPAAFLDYCGLTNHPFFHSDDCYNKVDAKILELANEWIAQEELGDKLRGLKGHYREHHKARRKFLVERGDLLSQRDGRKTLYRARRDDDPQPGAEPVEVIAEVVSDPIPPQQLAPTNSSNSLTTPKSLVQRRFEEVFRNNPDMSCFRGIVTGALEAIGVEVRWVEFEGKLWVMVKQAGELLELDQSTITLHFRDFPCEMSVLSTKLTGDRLKAFKHLYLDTTHAPVLLNWSDQFSKTGAWGIDDLSVNERSPHLILISPAGLAWLASKSETAPAKAIMQTDWIVKAELPGKLQESLTRVADAAKTPAGQHTTSGDLAEIAMTRLMQEFMQEVRKNNDRQTHALRNVRPPIHAINACLAKESLHPLMGSTGEFIWHQWNKETPYKTSRPIIYMIFADILRRGFHTDIVSIGISEEGASEKYPRICRSHERIEILFNLGYSFDVFILELIEPKYTDEVTLNNLERQLTAKLKPVWETLMNKHIRQDWRNAKLDTGQQELDLASL